MNTGPKQHYEVLYNYTTLLVRFCVLKITTPTVNSHSTASYCKKMVSIAEYGTHNCTVQLRY